ncbi:LytTR family DNA-binding domain-containing protein [Cognatiluteimonas weifangensis]|uniref:LytTR family transcriptional regulator n=1 Tax=Cognatiluteimonas weifangensis TaxID=2303539 RepID=A0A372DP15_9GAMM|nr:LytTR family DNA-binding domain-containing protein [Luteimonas weifangensis]RFP61234.1 LytTR family transcriptional regulator [Luteimonas weifangensis]
MPSPAATAYRRFLPWKPWLEAGFWLAATAINAFANSAVAILEYQRRGEPMATWEPLAWEWSSNLMVLALVPATAWFTRRWALHWDTWRRRWPLYLAASGVWSLLHIGGMAALRHAAYAAHGERYVFGYWPREIAYEYLKDLRSFLLIAGIMLAYRWLLRSWQGEARLLDAPDEGAAAEPVERPERFLVRKLGREFLVSTADIEWLQAAGNYVNLRVRGHDYPLRSTIAGIQMRLDPARFARIHRSYIVNLDQLAAIEPLDTGDARVHLKDGTALPCSRRHRDALRERAGAGEPLSARPPA